MEQCSLIAAPYASDGRVLGVLGVIGPTRMDYDRVITTVQATAQALSRTMAERTGLAVGAAMAAIALRSPIAAMALPHPARPWVFAAWPSHPARAPASGPCPDFGRPPGRRRPPLSRFPLRPMTMHPEQDDVTTPARSEAHTSELQSLLRISYAG